MLNSWLLNSIELNGSRNKGVNIPSLLLPVFPKIKPNIVESINNIELTIDILNVDVGDKVIVQKGITPEGETSKTWSYLSDALLVHGSLSNGKWQAIIPKSVLFGEYFFRFKVVR